MYLLHIDRIGKMGDLLYLPKTTTKVNLFSIQYDCDTFKRECIIFFFVSLRILPHCVETIQNKGLGLKIRKQLIHHSIIFFLAS